MSGLGYTGGNSSLGNVAKDVRFVKAKEPVVVAPTPEKIKDEKKKNGVDQRVLNKPHTLHSSMSHTKKNVKQESHATPESSSSTPHVYDEQLDNITTALHETNTKISGLASILYSLYSRFDSKFTSL